MRELNERLGPIGIERFAYLFDGVLIFQVLTILTTDSTTLNSLITERELYRRFLLQAVLRACAGSRSGVRFQRS